jgi:hypothetical protein
MCHANYIIPCGTVLLEKPLVSQLLKTFPALYTHLTFITMFTRARHLSLSCVTSIQYTTQNISWRCILVLYSHMRPGVKSGPFPSGFPTKALYALLYPIRATNLAHLILLNLIIQLNIWCGMQIMKLLIMKSSPVPCYFSTFKLKYLSQHPIFEQLQPMFRP